MSTIPIPCKDVSCQQLLSSSDVIHYGGLRQRQTVHRIVESTLPTVINIKWSRRYAVLHGGCLYLFKDEMSPHPLHSSTSLFGFTTCSCCSQEVSGHIPWPFKLASELEPRPRVYYFSSASQNESLKWVEKIQQQMIIANNYLPCVPQKGTTFHLFPSDAPSGEALPLQRARNRSGSDPVTFTSSRRNRLLPPTPNVATQAADNGVRRKISAEAVTEDASAVDTDDDNGDDYDELIDISKPVKEGLIVGLRKLMSLSRSDSEDADKKLPHSFSAPSAFVEHIEDADSDDSGPTSDKPGIDTTPTLSSSSGTMSPTATLRSKPITAVKPCVSTKKTSPQPPRPADKQTESSPLPPKPIPRKRTFSDSRTFVEPGLTGAYWSKTANEGEELMKSMTTVGTYMIRESQEPGQQTLMVRCEDSVRKYRIFADEEGKFYLDATNPRFTTRSALVSHYKKHYLPQRTVVLTKPYSTVLLTTAHAAATPAVVAAATYI